MSRWFKMAGAIALMSFVAFTITSYSSAQAYAGIKCKLVNKETGKGVPAEFSARVKDTIDPLFACIDTTGNGCTINVPDPGKTYEVRCFPWNADLGLVDTTLTQVITGRHAAVVDTRLIVTKGDGAAEFSCRNFAPAPSTYTDMK